MQVDIYIWFSLYHIEVECNINTISHFFFFTLQSSFMKTLLHSQSCELPLLPMVHFFIGEQRH